MDKVKQNKTFIPLGASNHVLSERSDHDFYATDPKAVRFLIENEKFNNNIWEPATGMGHIANEFIHSGFNVKMTDLFEYDVDGCDTGVDFLQCNEMFDGDIVTNPPYNKSTEFVEHALKLIPEGNKVVMFLKIQFLETTKRYEQIFKINPPKKIYVAVKRFACKKDGDFTKDLGSALCYCWFVWEKGFKGDPIIKWFNYDNNIENSLW